MPPSSSYIISEQIFLFALIVMEILCRSSHALFFMFIKSLGPTSDNSASNKPKITKVKWYEKNPNLAGNLPNCQHCFCSRSRSARHEKRETRKRRVVAIREWALSVDRCGQVFTHHFGGRDHHTLRNNNNSTLDTTFNSIPRSPSCNYKCVGSRRNQQQPLHNNTLRARVPFLPSIHPSIRRPSSIPFFVCPKRVKHHTQNERQQQQ